MPTFASHVMDNFGGFLCKYGLERYVLVTWITKYKVHQPIRLEMIVGCVVIQYGGPVGRAREQCTQILETVDAAQPNSRRSAAKQSTECTSTK